MNAKSILKVPVAKQLAADGAAVVVNYSLACHAMRHLITISILLFAFVPEVAQAKRIPAPKVEPVVYEGVRYVAPNDNGQHGYIQAWDTSTNRMLWSVTVFRNRINPLLEEDVQWIYIRKLRVEDGKLIVVDEKDRAYSVDLKTHGVRRLWKIPSEKPQATGAGGKAVGS